MNNGRSLRFWASGHDELIKSLCEDEEKELAPLQDALDRSKLEQKRIEAEICLIKKRFKKKRREAGGSLFARS